jgi:hypothetical protein
MVVSFVAAWRSGETRLCHWMGASIHLQIATPAAMVILDAQSSLAPGQEFPPDSRARLTAIKIPHFSDGGWARAPLSEPL